MKRTFPGFARIVVAGLVSIFVSLLAQGADVEDKAIASRTQEVDGVRVHYLTAGQGPAVILLHGYAETSRMWRPIIPVLAERFRVIAPDLPGIGDSGIPANGSDMKTAAIRMHGLARALEWKKLEWWGMTSG